MASSSAALVTLLVARSAAMAAATTYYNVGDEKGWATGVNYSGWTSGKSFVVGDILVFNYTPKAHSVTEVSTRSDYASCSPTHGVGISEDIPPTIVNLTIPGTHYYICLYHCDAGMKLAVTVAAAGYGSGSSSGGRVTSSGASLRVPAMGAAVVAAAGALIMVALF